MKWHNRIVTLGLMGSPMLIAQTAQPQSVAINGLESTPINQDPSSSPSNTLSIGFVNLAQQTGSRSAYPSFSFGVPVFQSLPHSKSDMASLSCRLNRSFFDNTRYGAYLIFGIEAGQNFLSQVIDISSLKWIRSNPQGYNNLSWAFPWQGRLIAGQVYSYRVVVVDLDSGPNPYFCPPIIISDFNLQAPPMVTTEVYQAGSQSPIVVSGQSVRFLARVRSNFSMQAFGFTPRLEQPNDGISGNLVPITAEILWGGKQGDYSNIFGWYPSMNPYGWSNFMLYNPNNLTQILDYVEIRP